MQIRYKVHLPWGRREESCEELLHDRGANDEQPRRSLQELRGRREVGCGGFYVMAEPEASSSDVSLGSSDLQGQLCHRRWRTRRVWSCVEEMRTKDTWFLAYTKGFYSDSPQRCARWAEYHTGMENVSRQQILWPSKHLTLGLPFPIPNYNLEY
jgi:hypothetical protein